ncbi:MAG: GAF domain-containing protein, partial [bacterium]|nr:GAF domain-containing protein [Candidatus Kapabacteria bacterium]
MSSPIRLLHYGIAVGAIACALLVQWATWPLLELTPYQLFYLIVGVVAWRYGTGPASLAFALGLLAVDYQFVPPLYVLNLGVDAIGPILVAAVATLALARLGESARRTSRELANVQSELERRVEERTQQLGQMNTELIRENREREHAQQALVQSERQSRLISDNILDVITVLGPDGQIKYESPSVERVLGYRAGELIDTNAFERVHADDLPGVLDVFQLAISEPGTSRAVQLRFRHRDGSWRVLDVIGRNLIDDPGVAGILISSRDVTDRWETERKLARQQEFLRAVLENAQDAIVAFDADGDLTLINRAAREIYPPARPSIAIDEWLAAFELFDVDGVRLDPSAVPMMRAVRGEHFRDAALVIRPHSGDERRLLASGQPIIDESGSRIGAVIVAHDITGLVRAEREREGHIREQVARRAGEVQQRRLEFLVNAGAVLAESLDFEKTLGNVSRFALGTLADWCVVDVLDEDGRAVRIAAAHADPAKSELVKELLRFSPSSAKTAGVPNVLRSGVPEIVREITDEFLLEAAIDDEHLAIVRELGTQSAMFVPLVAHDRVVGAISFFTSTERRFDDDDLTLASELARRGGLAIESARLYEAERRARTLVEQSAVRTEQLQEITAAFGEAMTAQQVAEVMIDRGLSISGAVAGLIGVVAESGQEVEIVRSKGYVPDDVRNWLRFSIDTPAPIAHAAKVGEPVFFASREEFVEAYPLIGVNLQTDHSAWAAVPLVAEDRIIGTLGLSFTEASGVARENRQLILALARQCGQALDRARLYDAERIARAEAERARRSLGAIAEASAVLSSQLDFHATLRSIARLAVPMLADTCVVDVLEVDGTMRRVAVSGATHAAERILMELMRSNPTGSQESLRYKVLDRDQPILITHIDDEWIRRVATDETQEKLLRELGQRSYLYLPLRARGRTFGAIGLAMLDGRRGFSEADIPESQEIALRAAIALDNARLYEEAQEANRAKDEFLATVSHEIRTPLNAILGWSQMLRDGALDEETAEHAVEAIERNAKAQAQIIEDILDISRVIAGKLRLEPRRIELGQVVIASLDAVRPPAEAAAVALVANVPDGLPTIVADAGRLQQVLWNLLLNAVKFTPEGGRVTLDIAVLSNEIEISVTDTGAG